MTQTTAPAPPPTPLEPADHDAPPSVVSRALRALLTQRIVLLAALLVIVLVWMTALDVGGYLTGSYDADYLAGTLVDAVPLCLLALGELVVIVSGRGGIDLSIGAIVSLTGMVFGFAYGRWGWDLWTSIILAVVVGALLGAVNGVMVAYLRFPALIATLASYYAYKSLALVLTNSTPISDPKIAELYSITRPVEIPVIGRMLPDVPLGVFTFLVPAIIVIWLLVTRTTYGRRLFAIGTNDIAAEWSGLDVRRTRFAAYVIAGTIAGVVAVYICAQFASARPDAGTTGNGLALPGHHRRGPRRRRHHRWDRPGRRRRPRDGAHHVAQRRDPARLHRERRQPVPAARPRHRAGLRRAAQRDHRPPLRRCPLMPTTWEPDLVLPGAGHPDEAAR